MPFYEYECQACKFYTELLQKISDEPLKKCPSCGKNQMKKLVSAPVFRLKGSGWYETDFKSDKENKRNLAVEKEAESASTGSEEKSGESKGGETKPADSKPAESKSAESGSAGSGSAAGSKRPAAKARPGAASSSRSPSRPAAKKKAPAKKSRPAPRKGK